MIITDFVAEAALGAAAAQVNVGNFVIAEWSDILFGIRPMAVPTVWTPGDSNMCTFQLASNEIKGFQPIDFVMSPSSQGIAANSGAIQPVLGHYQPLNVQPIYGGETVTFQITVEDAMGGNGAGMCTVWYGQWGAGDRMPGSYDPMPGRQRYGVACAWTASGVAGARAGPVAFNVVGGSHITRFDGVMGRAAVIAAGDASSGQYELQSSGFATSPLRVSQSSTVGPLLGTGAEVAIPVMTREVEWLPIDRFTVIDAYFDAHATSVATDMWQVDVEFIRPAPDET